MPSKLHNSYKKYVDNVKQTCYNDSMKLILYNGEALKKYRARKRKRKGRVIWKAVVVLLLLCIAAISLLGHWAEIEKLFVKEEPHTHDWQAASVKNASCVEDGLVLRCCTGCGEEEKIILPAYGHQLSKNFCLECGQRASDGLKFQFLTDAEGVSYAVVMGIGTCTDRNLIIPNIIGGIAVTEIAESAFRGNMQIHSVTFHTGIVKIGKDAFDDCENLASIFLPEGLPERIVFGQFHNTAYFNENGNWQGNELYCNGYFIEGIDTVA